MPSHGPMRVVVNELRPAARRAHLPILFAKNHFPGRARPDLTCDMSLDLVVFSQVVPGAQQLDIFGG